MTSKDRRRSSEFKKRLAPLARAETFNSRMLGQKLSSMCQSSRHHRALLLSPSEAGTNEPSMVNIEMVGMENADEKVHAAVSAETMKTPTEEKNVRATAEPLGFQPYATNGCGQGPAINIECCCCGNSTAGIQSCHENPLMPPSSSRTSESTNDSAKKDYHRVTYNKFESIVVIEKSKMSLLGPSRTTKIKKRH